MGDESRLRTFQRAGVALASVGRRAGQIFTPAIWREKLEEVKAAERRTRLAQDRRREALDALPQGIVFLDPEGRYVR